MTKFWCGVVSKEHIMRGVGGGFCQVCHGKRSPLDRMSVGDGIVFYSPTLEFRKKEKCQSFTAIGTVVGSRSYQFQMAPDFIPFRRDVEYVDAHPVGIGHLLGQLDLTKGRTNWGYNFKFGHFEITEHDFMLIAECMVASDADRERLPRTRTAGTLLEI